MQSLLKQFTILNCILAAGILAIGYFLLLPAFTKEVRVVVAAVTPKATEEKKGEVAEAQNPPMQDYAVVAEKNLFHPDRIIPAIKEEANVPRPEFVLFGTLISDRMSIAYISDTKAPRTTPGRGQRQTGLKIGETMSGYILKEVLHDRVVMVRGDDRIEIGLTASKKKRGTETTAPAQPSAPAVARPGLPPAAAFPGMPVQQPGQVATPSPVAPQRPTLPRTRRPNPSVIQQPQPQ